ncbi:glucose-6-phosphate 1-epimerase [Mariprofundus ferrinatatus]|uniref:Putative glucose-6-phosphate 1-epimerase n=1 Tax=Mariprofundus ferrinatatus TaxID=1921087 RepID=A0A2K8L4C3_9PROT|nr:D-hexose-6-phosphate mutarotase [Mariprofundus ferrinatatus]ATX82093.1 glucose-6-phosphate 1-epimerase [Mariprofundus ferrinatatus]
MSAKISKLNHNFGIAGQILFRDAGDGFIVIDIKNSFCNATIAVQGAHLMTWNPKGQKPVIWMSPVAKLAPGKSIRGGVPICWPWFGAHASEPSYSGHGFARTVAWDVIDTAALDNGSTFVAFRIAEVNKEQWPYNAPAEMYMTIGATLEMELVTDNLGSREITVGDALHTYFCVSDVSKSTIRGLDGCDYLDKVGPAARRTQQGDITIGSEVDRIYLDQGQDVVIEDPGLKRAIRIEKRGSNSTIVWNPWIEKCIKMGDFGSDDGYLGMVCVESANAAEDVVKLAPGDSHRLWVRYSVE